jgi:RNA polymerase sigma-B factor
MPVVLGDGSPSLLSSAVPEQGCRANADRLVSAYHHLCSRGARKFWRTGLERCDLEQVAAIGLIKASRRYKPETATPFEAYAWLVIVGELMHYVRDHELPVRIPRRLRTLEPQFNRAYETCSNRLSREPSDADIALEMGLLPHTIAELRMMRASGTMLPIDDPGARALPISSPVALEDRLMVQDAFAALSTLERRVVAGVYLLGLNQRELGRSLGLSSRRIGAIRTAALQRMQRAWAS